MESAMKTLASFPLHAAAAAALAGLITGCAAPVTRVTRVVDEPPRFAPAPAWDRYGSVMRIEEVQTSAQPTGGGALLGGLIGGVVGNQFGHGAGRAGMTALGVFGGAVVGDNAERNQAAASSSHYYRVFVRFDDGQRREFDYGDLAGLRTGERVRLHDGVLQRG
jgi:outer membrane lipoprotein SlyB